MKIDEILEQDDGFLLGGIDDSNIVKIGDIKDGNDGPYQFITLADPRNMINELRVKLKFKDHFIDNEYDTVSFIAGKPGNDRKPRGIKVSNKDGKIMVIVTKEATAKYSARGSEEFEPEKKEEPVKEKEVQLTEKVNPVTPQFDFDPGPNDDLIVKTFYEHVHIMNVIRAENYKLDYPFEYEQLCQLKTGIYIEASRANKAILPAKKPKTKYDDYKKPEPKKEEPKEEPPVASYMVSDPEKMALKNIDSLAKEPAFNVPHGEYTVGYKFTGFKVRCAMLAWYFRKDYNSLSDKLKKVHNAIRTILNKVSTSTFSWIVGAAIIEDFAEVNQFSVKYDSVDSMDEAEKELGKLKLAGSNTAEIAKSYFALSQEEKVIS